MRRRLPRLGARHAVAAGVCAAGLLFAGAASAQDTVRLTVQLSGSGAGTVTQIFGPGPGITCASPNPGGNVCSEDIEASVPGPFVGLSADAADDSVFVEWTVSPDDTVTEGCGFELTCYVELDDDVTVTAQFDSAPKTSTLQVTRKGTGATLGEIKSDPAGIDCGGTPSDCSASFPDGTIVVLTASTSSGATFAGWGDDCEFTGSETTCLILMTTDRNVSATFDAVQQPLTVTVQGSGGVSSNVQPGIQCPTTCKASFAQGSKVTLYAQPGTNSRFTGWSGGGCSGTGTCTVTLTAPTSVTAAFAVITQPLTVTVKGKGTVTSSPSGIDCPTDCQATFPQGTKVTLSAKAAAGYAFAGWSGAGCSGTGQCAVTVSAAATVTATFSRTPVKASLGPVRVTATGPPSARRVLDVTVVAGERVNLRLRVLRGSATLKTIAARGLGTGSHRYRLPIANSRAGGVVRVQAVFTNVAGTTKVQTASVRIPARPKR